MKIEVSQVIARPPAVVFRFVVVDHVRNHPRWDPKMELQQISEGPIRVGTIIRRRHTHTGSITEGTMDVVEYEPDRTFGMVIHDGPVEMRSRMTFEPDGQGGTIIRGNLDIPAMKEPIDQRPFEQSLR